MVTLPGSFAQVGYMEGILLLLVAATAASCSLFLLNWSCNYINTIIIQKQKQQKQKQQKQNQTQSNSDDNEDETAASNTTSSYASLVAFTLGHSGSNILELLTLTYCLGQGMYFLLLL
jgi:flagellar biosynthesis component FlhA